MYKPTGSNMTPLGVKRRFGGDSSGQSSTSPSENESSHAPARSESYNDYPAARSEPSTASPTANSDGSTTKRKRRSRWGGEQEKVVIPGLPTTISKANRDMSDKYLLQLRIEEINRKLRSGEFVPPDRQRSPSPEPVYNAEGKRVNTREARYKKKLEDERHKLIEKAIKTIPNYRPPADYKKPTKLQEKVYIPAKEFPDINFIGQLIGPRGNTLKSMEAESGAKISIRGRGSVKEGKGQVSNPNSGQEEDLHCLVTADTEEKVKKAVKLIEKVIETSASVPEGQNELKRNQLRELAALNGTLRDDENQTCLNCGASGHRRFECPERQNITSTLTCHICGGLGHISRDCNQRHNPEMTNQARQRDAQLDSEYMNLMAELGESVTGGSREGAGSYTESKPAPWQQPRTSTGAAPPWQQQNRGPAPWANNNYNNYNSHASGPPPPPGTGSGGAAPWHQGGGGGGGGGDAYQSSYGNAPGTATDYYAAYGGYGGYYDPSQYDPSQMAAAPPGSTASPWGAAVAVPPPPAADGSNPWNMPPPPPSTDDAAIAPPPPSASELPPPPPPPGA